MVRIVRMALVALLALTGSASARTAAPHVQAAEPALWMIRDADSTMYFYGTIHLRKAGAPWGGSAAEQALAEAQEVWTEVEISAARDAELQGVVGRMGYDPAHTLSSLMTPARAAQLKTAAASLGMPLTQLDQMKPWLASLTISVVPMVQAGYDPEAGVDHSVDRIARAAGKRMRWFETGEQQIQFMAGFADPLQLEMLYDSMDDLAKGTAEMQRMEAAWEVGDDATLAHDMVADMARQYPELYDVMLKRRNAAWADVLTREMAGSGVDFIAVGTAHLVGPDSVLALMRARGFKVERISPRQRR